MNSSLRSQETDGTKGRGCVKRNLHGAALCSDLRKRESAVCLVPSFFGPCLVLHSSREGLATVRPWTKSRGNATSDLSAALSGSNSTHIWKQVTVMFIGRNAPVCGPQLFTTHNRVSHPRLCGCWCLCPGQR